jgi:hypothetical protein
MKSLPAVNCIHEMRVPTEKLEGNSVPVSLQMGLVYVKLINLSRFES